MIGVTSALCPVLKRILRQIVTIAPFTLSYVYEMTFNSLLLNAICNSQSNFQGRTQKK